MLLAVLVVESSGFALFEYFPDKQYADRVIKGIDKIDIDESETEFEGLMYYLKPFSDQFTLCLVYRDEELTNTIIQNTEQIGSQIMRGDKVTLRQVLSSTRLSDLETLQ